MTSRRKAWLLVAVLGVAAVGLMVGYEPLRVVLLYEQEGTSTLDVRQRRWSWLPTQSHIIPPQVCSMCSVDAHDRCGELWLPVTEERSIEWELMWQRLEDPDDWKQATADFRCTCTHPSHQDD